MFPLLLIPLLVAVDLSNTGEPIRIPFACIEEDLQAVGMACTETSPCPVYLELNAAAANGTKLVVAGDFHSTNATIQSVLLVSPDSGATWKEPVQRIRGAALDLAQFADGDHAFAAGETQYPLPRDPFFLISTDGGQFWRNRPVGEEDSPGSVVSFSFDTPTHGDLVIDAGTTAEGGRYLGYETRTGGDTWMARSRVREQPRIRPRIENTRVQESKDGRSWVIERRSGDTWLPIASFLVDAATCTGPSEPADDHNAGGDKK